MNENNKQLKSTLVRNFILEEIRLGKILSGERLPSCRDMALRLKVNKITVNKVLRELEAEHKVYSIPRGGFYLVGADQNEKKENVKIDYRMVTPSEKLIPYREFTHVMNKVIDMHKNSLFRYESPNGLLSLRNTLKSEFEKDGVYTKADNIIITHGAQQAINLAFQAIFHKSQGKLLVEAPTYSLALELSQHLNIEVVAIKRGINGYDYDKLEKLFKLGGVKAFYVIPRHHNPTGYTLTEKDKQRIVVLASRYNVIIIEDDYLSDLGSAKGYLPIHYYDTKETTIYIRSFSKTFMPGIRIGAAVVPSPLISKIISFKHLSDLNTAVLPQAALDLFIKSGMYDRHITKVRKSNKNKLRIVSDILNSFYTDNFECLIPEHGIFVWLHIKDNRDATNILKLLENEGILIKSAEDSFLKSWCMENKNINVNNFFRLCILSITEENLSSFAKLLQYFS